MTRPYQPIDPGRITTYSVARRKHKASVARAVSLPQPGASARELIAAMPDYLGATAFRRVVEAIVRAVQHHRPVVVAFGAHVLKVGCGPIIIDLIRRGIVQAVVCHGACAIHDVELAMLGETSEEVADTIRDGTFGMVEETMAFFDDVSHRAARDGLGLGQTVGALLVEREAPHLEQSILAAAHQAGIPACVFVAMGTDTVHASPGWDGAAIGAAAMIDFRLVCDVVSDLGAADPDATAPGATGESGAGGVWANIGSAVILPEVFLKAVSVARNLGADLDAMTTANFDMIRHYRPHQNVVARPVSAGRGHEVIGHHEILLPLLRQAVVEELAMGSTSP